MVIRRFVSGRAVDLNGVWSDLVGSRKMFASHEVMKINELIEQQVISAHLGYNLYLTSKHWKRLRMRVLRRAGFKCEGCKAKLPLQVDHLSYRKIGEDSLDNLQALCIYCHAEKTKAYDLLSRSKKVKANISIEKQLYAVMRK